MIIIFGTRAREVDIEKGEFFCPACNRQRRYARKSIAQYFTLFFIPVLRISNREEYVLCEECEQAYKPTILQYRPPNEMEIIAERFLKDLKSGTPVSMARQKILNDGIKESDMKAALNGTYNASDLNECKACQLEFDKSIKHCSVCGASL